MRKTQLQCEEKETELETLINRESGIPLGEGTFGFVRTCVYRRRPAALKIMKRHQTNDDIFFTSILREISALRRLSHPNIVSLMDYQVAPTACVVLEQCTTNLGRFLRNKPRPSQSIIKNISRQILNGLAFIHEQGWIHRDLKLANILVCDDGNENVRIKLSDFGASRKVDYPGEVPITPGRGTICYLSPESLMKSFEHYCTSSMDMWAFGIMFVEIFTGGKRSQNWLFGNEKYHQLYLILCFLHVETWPVIKNDARYMNIIIHSKNPPPTPTKSAFEILTTSLGLDKTSADFALQFLVLDPNKRLSAKEALEHPYLKI